MPPQDIVHGEDKVLRHALTHVTQRLRFARWTRHASRGALAAAAFAVGVIILQKFILPDWPPLPFAVFCLLLLGIGIGTATAYARPIDLMTAARLAEARLGLKERLSSALEFERSTALENDPEALLLRRLQQQDAAAHAHAMQPAAAVPFAMPWEAKASLAAWLAIAIVLVLPSLPFMTPPALRVEHAIVQKSGTRLADAARHLQKQADAQNLPETARAARAMQALARRMQNRHLDKRQAMAAVSQAEEQIAEQQRRQAQTSSMTQSGKTLEQAGRELSKSLSAADARSAPSADGLEMRDTARAMQQGDSNGLSKQMRALAQRRNAGPGSSLKNAQDLQRLANALQGKQLSETQRHVQAAADAAKRGNQAEAAFEMRQAADSASRETLQQDTAQRDAQGLQEARQTLQDSRQQMAAQSATPQNNSSRSAAPQNTPSGNAASPSAQTPSGQTGPGSASDRHGQAGGAAQGSQAGSSKNTAGASARPGSGQTAGASGQGASGSQSGGSHSGGAPSNGGGGSGKAAAASPGPGRYSPSSVTGQVTPAQPAGIVHGTAHPLDAHFNPSHSPLYGRIFLGRGDGKSGGAAGHSTSGGPQHPLAGGAGTVPYSNEIAPARKTAETAMDREDIPPSYRNNVQRYFDALQSHAAK